MDGGTLDVAVGSLIKKVRDNVLGVPTSTFDAADWGTIDSGTEISCTALEQLHPGKCLDNWMIAVVIQIPNV
jgi:hypothetical protein